MLKLLVRVAVITAVGMAISLGAGTLLSTLPRSPMEGVYAGVLLTSVLAALIYFVLTRLRGSRKLNPWLFDIHSALGLITGVLLSVIFLTGVLLIYRAEIDVMVNPWLEVEKGAQHAPVDEWIAAVDARTQTGASNKIDITWPHREDVAAHIRVDGQSFYVNPYTSKVLEGNFKSSMPLVKRIHAAFKMGTIGHWLTGLVALATVWLCIGGVSMGRRVFKEWYVLRWNKGLRIFLTDLHKRFGLWLWPFIAINAFAGMMAALFGPFSIGPVQMNFDGSYNTMYQAVGSPKHVNRTEFAAPLPLEEFVSVAKQQLEGAKIYEMRIAGFGDQNSVVSVRASKTGTLAPKGASLILNMRTSNGEILLQKEIAKAGIFERITQALNAFHFAQYGGKGIELLHAVTATIISIVPFLGMAMWFMRRNRLHKKSKKKPSRKRRKTRNRTVSTPR